MGLIAIRVTFNGFLNPKPLENTLTERRLRLLNTCRVSEAIQTIFSLSGRLDKCF